MPHSFRNRRSSDLFLAGIETSGCGRSPQYAPACSPGCLERDIVFRETAVVERRAGRAAGAACTGIALIATRGAPPAALTTTLATALAAGRTAKHQIGRASCRERVGQYVEILVVAVSLKKKKT